MPVHDGAQTIGEDGAVVLVVGGSNMGRREWAACLEALDRWADEHGPGGIAGADLVAELHHGGRSGVASAAAAWARSRGTREVGAPPPEPSPPKGRNGKPLSPARLRKRRTWRTVRAAIDASHKYNLPLVVVAAWNGMSDGTALAIAIATAEGLPVVLHRAWGRAA